MKETLEEAAERLYPFALDGIGNVEVDKKNHFIKGAKWQQERMYEIMNNYTDDVMGGCTLMAKEWFEQYKKK